MRNSFLLQILLLLAISPAGAIAAQNSPAIQVKKVAPLYWWAGMSEPRLQVLLYGTGLGNATVELDTPNVQLQEVVRPSNPNYLLLYINTAGSQPQQFNILLHHNGKKLTVPYQLHARKKGSREVKGFDSSDVLYLIMPDRFANGDPKNDVIPSLREKKVDRNNPDARHGGDLKGIENQLDYLQNLGITALWLNPIQENDMPQGSYHGYAITDYYQVDPRLGSLADMQRLVKKAHSKGIKVVMDMIFNHCGSYNYLFQDRPDSTWFNFQSRYVPTHYRTGTIQDPHAAAHDKLLATDGWFTETMPDFNQRNTHVATYLIQSSIWWIEATGIAGIRQDTHPYADFQMMAQWCKAVREEYPHFNIVGETWLNNPPQVAYWQADSKLSAPLNSHLPTVMDFPLMDKIGRAFDEESDNWNNGLARLYDCLSCDFVYPHPSQLLIFADNHDTSRFYKTVEQTGNLNRFKQMVTFLLTTRGIPQLYYGTELLMAGDKAQGDGALRQDFPCGWEGQPANLTNALERKGNVAQAYNFLQQLLHYRKSSPALQYGSLTHFPLQHGVYVYARIHGNKRVVVMLNGTSSPQTINLAPYALVLQPGNYREALSNTPLSVGQTLTLPPRAAWLLEPVTKQ